MKRRNRQSPFSLFSFQDIITGLCGILVLFVLIMVVDLVMRRDMASAPSVPAIVPDDPKASEASLLAEIETLEREIAAIRETLATRRIANAGGVSVERKDEADRDMSEKERRIAALVSRADALRTRLEKARDANAKSKRELLKMESTKRNLEAGLAEMNNRNGVTLIPERGNLKSPVYIVLGRGEVEIHRPLDSGAGPVRATQRDVAETVSSVLSPIDSETHTVVLLVRPSGAADMMPLADLVKSMGFACGRDPLEEDVDVAFGAASGGLQ